jgi:acetyl-CoA synthetase
LCIKAPWPGIMRTLQGDHARYETTYFAPFKGFYFSGDGCRRDKDGYYWLTGRVDDVINVSGHRIGTAEVESALVSHPQCAEAAVVGFDHEVDHFSWVVIIVDTSLFSSFWYIVFPLCVCSTRHFCTSYQ